MLREVDPQYISGSAWRQIQPYYWYFPTVNDHLEAALARNPNLTLVDWRAAANRPGITYDAIHLNTTGAELYSNLIRQAIDTASTRVGDRSTTKVHVPGERRRSSGGGQSHDDRAAGTRLPHAASRDHRFPWPRCTTTSATRWPLTPALSRSMPAVISA